MKTIRICSKALVTIGISIYSNENMPPETQAVVDYFEDTWIGRPQRRQHRCVPQFSHEMWNCVRGLHQVLLYI